VPRPPIDSAKHRRRYVALPGLLADTVRRRWEEFRYPGFSPFGLELICFDLRLRVPHEVTLRFARENPKVQAAIDRLLVAQYRPGAERNGILIQAARGEFAPAARPAPSGSFAIFRNEVRFANTLAPCIATRFPEAGYAGFSAYVTALLRYDLMLLGPHTYFNGDDVDPEMLAALDRETHREFHENRQPKRIYLDRVLEEVAGRPLTQQELSARKHELAEIIIQRALEADRQGKSGG
jgi:hypothetical protein